jgi:hypothetical protein
LIITGTVATPGCKRLRPLPSRAPPRRGLVGCTSKW